MGEFQGTLFQPDFNRSIRAEARSERLSGDAGALLLRAQGWTDHSDATLLRQDPLLRLAVSERRGAAPVRGAEGRRTPDGLASQPTLSRFLAMLAEEENRAALGRALLTLTKRRLGLRQGRWLAEAIVDMDSLPIEVYGHQPGTAYNGHYRLRCCHPLVARLADGDFLGGKLREVQAHTADGGQAFVLPILEDLAQHYLEVWLRVDAGFPEPDLLRALEARDFRYVARLRGNRTLHRLAEPYLKRPPGRPPREGRTWVHDLSYQAGSWDTPRRVVLVVLERPGEQGELFLDHFFLLTNAPREEMDGFQLLERYRGAWRCRARLWGAEQCLPGRTPVRAPSQGPLPGATDRHPEPPLRRLRGQRGALAPHAPRRQPPARLAHRTLRPYHDHTTTSGCRRE